MARVFRSVTCLPEENDTCLPEENDTAVGTGLVEGQSDASTAIGIDIDIVSAGSATVSRRLQRVIPMAMRMLVATVRDIGKERPSKRLT